MRGLKLVTMYAKVNNIGRIFYRCVDWNANAHLAYFATPVASFTDAWIETNPDILIALSEGRIFYRCVDWNIFVWMGNIIGIVASFTDAWIETIPGEHPNQNQWSHLLQMRGLKQICHRIKRRSRSRIFYRCVDWNNKIGVAFYNHNGRIFYRCVDWNLSRLIRLLEQYVASFTDAWIETNKEAWLSTVTSSHLLQMRGLKRWIMRACRLWQ